MLHQIVFSGDVKHLDEALASQIDHPVFRLLCKTADDKTVREVAASRAHVNGPMIRRIEQLVATDQILANARAKRWEQIKQIARQQPNLMNEKGPHQPHYLAHVLASMGELQAFQELHAIAPFRLDRKAGDKTIAQVARENDHNEFADYVEGLGEQDDEETSAHATGHTHFSPGFYDDVSISLMPANPDMSHLFSTTHGGGSSHYGRGGGGAAGGGHHHPHYSSHGHSHAAYTPSYSSHHSHEGHAAHGASASKPAFTAEQDAAYEQMVSHNATITSTQTFLPSLTCSITKAILRDPGKPFALFRLEVRHAIPRRIPWERSLYSCILVLAADGFTYEREAIVEWFRNSNRSPMTNEVLHDLNVKPNHAIKSMLQTLNETKTAPKAAKK